MTSRPAMSALRVQLFGKFSVSRDQELHGFEGSKTQDLFGYLMLKRRAPHTRESLAGSSGETARRLSQRSTCGRHFG